MNSCISPKSGEPTVSLWEPPVSATGLNGFCWEVQPSLSRLARTVQLKLCEAKRAEEKRMEMETNNTPAIEFHKVFLSYDEKLVLSDINFKLDRGEMIFMTGMSGSGKSVLLRLAIALEHPDSGQVLIEGQDVGSWSEVELLNLRGNR